MTSMPNDSSLNKVPLYKACRECAEQIPFIARKCWICDAHQDWRRLFFIGNSSLSLLVALISVLAVAVPVITRAITPKYERVTARVVSQRYEESLKHHALVVLISNDGTAPAFVDPNAGVSVNKGTKVFAVNLFPSPRQVESDPLRKNPDLSSLLFEASAQRVLFATILEQAPDITEREPNADCELTITVHSIDGSKREEKHRYRCFDWYAGRATR